MPATGKNVASAPTATDHLTPVQKAISVLVDGYFSNRGWGFCMSVVTGRENLSECVGTFDWDGGLGTVWAVDPREQLVTILMTQCEWTSPSPPSVALDFRTTASQAIADS
jgi:CubicO group peptidase (beta-lactamase class C family)